MERSVQKISMSETKVELVQSFLETEKRHAFQKEGIMVEFGALSAKFINLRDLEATHRVFHSVDKHCLTKNGLQASHAQKIGQSF